MAESSGSRRGRIDLTDIALRARDGCTRLADVDLSIDAGERVAIAGPNGAGKTSLLQILFGRLRPSRGMVSIDGRDLAGIPHAERGRLFAVVAQGEIPDGRLTLVEYVGLGRIPHHRRCAPERHARVVMDACEKVGLSGLAPRRLSSLSGGERQRAAIARAITQEPVVLVLYASGEGHLVSWPVEAEVIGVILGP
ncbi:MAG: ABC transporter ATP-binding protein [Methylorubrum populi]